MNFAEIKEIYKRDFPEYNDPYHFVKAEQLSPIESIVWGDIRCIGLRGVFMQFPILNYFVDFACPEHKFCIECDGKEFHLDIEKDLIRQANIENEGWKMYRIDGSSCMRESQIVFDKHIGNYFVGEHEVDSIIEMPHEDLIEFCHKYKFECSELLIIYLKNKYK